MVETKKFSKSVGVAVVILLQPSSVQLQLHSTSDRAAREMLIDIVYAYLRERGSSGCTIVFTDGELRKDVTATHPDGTRSSIAYETKSLKARSIDRVLSDEAASVDL